MDFLSLSGSIACKLRILACEKELTVTDLQTGPHRENRWQSAGNIYNRRIRAKFSYGADKHQVWPHTVCVHFG